MRFIIIISLFSMIWACGNPTDATAPAPPSSTAPAAQKNLRPAAKTNPNAIPSRNPDGESPDIRIKINGAQPGLVNIIGFYTGEQYRADSAMTDASGAVHFKHDEPWRSGLYYVSYPNNVAFQMIVADDQTFSLEADARDVNQTMKVTDSKDNQLLYETLVFEHANRQRYNAAKNAGNQSEMATILAERNKYMDGLFSNKDSFYAKYKEAGQNPNARTITLPDGSPDKQAQIWHYRRDFWENVDFNDLRLLNTPVVSNKLKKYVNELTAQNPDSIIASAQFLCDKALDYPEYFQYFANWITLNYDPLETTLMDPQAVYVFMIENYFTHNRAFWSDSVEIYGLQQRAYEMSASVAGKQGPDVNAPSLDGSLKSIYSLSTPYIIVYMYNPQCEHCAVQTPLLVQYMTPQKATEVSVYAIVVDTDDAEWRAYVKKNGMEKFVNVHDPTNQSIYAKYYVDHTPELYLLNPERKIIGKNLKVNQVEEMINRDKQNR